MIYLVCNDNKARKHLESSLEDKETSLLKDKNEIFDISYKADDLLILNLDEFEDIYEILNFTKEISNLKVIALRNTPNLAEGTLLIKKGVKSYYKLYIEKNVLNDILKVVQDGNTWVYPELMNYIIKQINISAEPKKNKMFEKLTKKENEVALLVASGNSNKEIAQSLKIALVTVKKHIGNIFEKLDVKDRVSLSILVNS